MVGAIDGIFSNEISNTLQMFTFPLEVIGLTLAMIEIRFPDTAALITKRMGVTLRSVEKWQKDLLQDMESDKLTREAVR
jgi:hypothetical protein|tara:strand:+ start:1796 stop:2032 length:237 start_codon:yes stop_codon:yes gene_type:complete